MEFDEAVDGLRTAVVGAVGVEVAEELGAPLLQGAAQAGDLRDRACGERGEDLLSDGPSGGVAVLVVGRADLLGAAPGELDFDVPLVSAPRRVQPCSLSVGEVLFAGAQDVADPVQRVVLAAAVAVDVLLDPATDLIDGLRGEVRSARGAVTVLPTVPFPRAASPTGRAACTAPGSPRVRAEVEPLGELGEGGPAGGDVAAVSVAGDRHRCRVEQCHLSVAGPPAGGPVSSPDLSRASWFSVPI